MSRWMRIGAFALVVPILLLAGLGIYSLVDSEPSSNASSFPGFQLVRPLFAQGTPAAFPDPAAGISAYIQVDPANQNLQDLLAGNDFVIDVTTITPMIWLQPGGFANVVDVRVYLDTSGLMVAYLTNDKPAAAIFQWPGWVSTSGKVTTVLETALISKTNQMGVTFPTTMVSWYDWEHPQATHLAAAAREGSGSMFMHIPAGATVPERPSFSFNSSGGGHFVR